MDNSNINSRLFSYIGRCVTPFQAVAHTSELLDGAGFEQLCESGSWQLKPGGKYYVTRNGSSLISFMLPEGAPAGFMMTAAHCDSPAFKIKDNAELEGGGYTRLSVEKYGGMLCSTWMDRPLSIAGRVVVSTDSGVEAHLVDFKRPAAVIPNVAIHMNRSANESSSFNAAVDMLPLYGGKCGDFKAELAALAGAKAEDILAADLFLYNPQQGVEWGDYISAPRLDDLQCAFASLSGFLAAQAGGSVPVYCLFDNEEVGSQTKQGAAGTFLRDVLCRIVSLMYGGGDELRRMMANSFLVSCDNAHGVHPNHPEYADKNHSVYLNGGIVIKYNANQKYTSDAVSSAIFRKICADAGAPVQLYANRADMAGGSTLGNIANTHVSLNTVDIGLAQLAMHSAFETAGGSDTGSLINALTAFFGSSLHMDADGQYTLKLS